MVIQSPYLNGRNKNTTDCWKDWKVYNFLAMSVKTVDFIWRSEILPYLIIRGKIKWIIKNRKITFATRKGRTYSFPFKRTSSSANCESGFNFIKQRLLAHIVNYAKKSYKAKGQILNGFVFTTENKVLCKNVPVRNPIPTRTNFVA